MSGPAEVVSSAYPIWADGEFHPAEARVVRADDPGLLLGLALFETLLWADGCLYFTAEHLRRLESGARGLGVAWPPPWDPELALAEYTARLGEGAAAVRVTLTPGAPGAGPSLILGARPKPALPADVSVLIAPHAKLAGATLEGYKTTSRARNVLARARAEELGAYDALLGTEAGDLSEGCNSNLYCVKEGTVTTPALDRGCLAGIVRQKLMADLAGAGQPVREAEVRPEDLLAAEEVFLTSSLARILPVREVIGLRADLPGARGEGVQALQSRFRSIEERYRA